MAINKSDSKRRIGKHQRKKALARMKRYKKRYKIGKNRCY